MHFIKDFLSAVDNLTNAVNVESEHDAGEYVQKVLGTEFSIPAKARFLRPYKIDGSIALDNKITVKEILATYDEISIVEEIIETVFLISMYGKQFCFLRHQRNGKI